MEFELLQMISLSGDVTRGNDDRAGATARLAWVIDGATDLGPPGLVGPMGGAAWLAGTAHAAFGRSAEAGLSATCGSVFDAVAAAYGAAAQRAPEGAWELPKAAFGAVALVETRLEVAWSADCPILMARGDKLHWCTPEPDTSQEAAAARSVGPLTEAAALADRRAHRGRPDHQAIGIDPAASKAATHFARFDVGPGDRLLVMSDGFSALISDYAAYDAPGLMAAAFQGGLADLACQLRRIEAEDAACTRYPRFKQSDDATAIMLRVVG